MKAVRRTDVTFENFSANFIVQKGGCKKRKRDRTGGVLSPFRGHVPRPRPHLRNALLRPSRKSLPCLTMHLRSLPSSILFLLLAVAMASTNAHSTPHSNNPLALPPPSHDHHQQQQQQQKRATLDLSSGSAPLTDHLGPLVVNKDGTTARITNWHAMTDDERQRTLRVISKRNRQRLEKLKEDLPHNL